MRRIKLSIGICATVLLSGCATDYHLYAKAQADLARAQADADAAKWRAIARLGEGGSDTARVAAIISMMAGGHGAAQPSLGSGLRAPQPAGESALRWASVLLPTLTNIYAIGATTRLGMAQSNNAAAVAQSTNNAFVGLAGKIQAPQANVTTNTSSSATTTTSTENTSSVTAGANSNLGAGAYTWTASDSHDTTATTNDRHDTTNTPPAQIPAGRICYVDSGGVLTCQ